MSNSKASFALGQILNERADALEREKRQQEALLNEQKSNGSVFGGSFVSERSKRLNESKTTFRNTANLVISNIVRYALPGNLLEEAKVFAAVEEYKGTIKHLLNEDAKVLRMPVLPHYHQNFYQQGQNKQTLEKLVQMVALSHTVALKNGSSPKTPDVTGVINGYNNIDTHIATGQAAVMRQNEIERGGAKDMINLSEESLQAIESLCEQASPVIKERVLKMFNAEVERKKEEAIAEEVLKEMYVQEFSNMEIEQLKRKQAKSKLHSHSLFEEAFLANKLRHPEANEEDLLQETVFNLVCLETFKETGLLKEGVNLLNEMASIRRELQRKAASY